MSATDIFTNKRGIARRLILAMVLFSTLITVVVTAIQLHRDYNRDLLLIDSQLKQIQDVHIPSIAGSLWLLDEKGMQVLVDGILQLPDILYLEVSDGEHLWASAGVHQNEKMILREYPLTYQYLGREEEIGSMTVVATLDRVYQRLIDKTVDILVSNAIRTFLVVGFILLLFHFLVTRRLISTGRDVARAVGSTAAYQQTRRQRKQVEMLFAHMKRILKMDRLQLRGISAARDEFLLTATARNLRRMAKSLSTGPPEIPVMAPI